MGKESRRRRRIARACARDTAPPTSILDVPDDLLDHILLRVRTPACLLRAAATCKPWRRVIAGAGSGFLRRFGSFHSSQRLLLGHYHGNPIGWLNFFPSPWLTALHLLRHRLSLDFLPQSNTFIHGMVTDSRGGLLAFVRDNWYAVICDPWTRQYTELHLPWEQQENKNCGYHCIGAFLLDADDDDGSLLSGFRVLCACFVRDYSDDTVTGGQACVFSAREKRWIWSRVSTGGVFRAQWAERFHTMHEWFWFVGRAGGSIIWSFHDGNVLVLDESSGEFGSFGLPSRSTYRRQELRVVGGGAGGAIRLVRLVEGDLEMLTRSHGASECTVERRVGLCQLANFGSSPSWWSWRFGDTAAGDLVLGASARCSPYATILFSLNVNTMKLRRLDKGMASSSHGQVFPYELPWCQAVRACL